MTMLDDDRLAALIADAAAAFEVPATGPEDILARAGGDLPTRGLMDEAGHDGHDDQVDAATTGDDLAPGARGVRLAGVAGRHRLLAVAACIVAVLALAGGIVALTRGPAGPTRTAALPRAAVRAPSRAPMTTTTAPGASSAGASASAAAPSDTAHAPAAGPANATTPTTTPPLPSGAVGQSAKIEQTGSLALTVGRGTLGRTVTRLTTLAGANGGFVANEQSQSGAANGGSPSGSVTLQVPVQSFTTVLTSAEALGKVSDLTTKATDVTGQYVDLQARIAALQDSRQQYLSILAKATTVGDVLAVQEQIEALQTQIEQLQGQLQLLTSQTTYSTLTVTVNEHTPAPPPSARPLPESGLVRAWHASIGGFVAGVEGLVRLAGPLLFVLLLLGVVLTGGRALWRRYQRHKL